MAAADKSKTTYKAYMATCLKAPCQHRGGRACRDDGQAGCGRRR